MQRLFAVSLLGLLAWAAWRLYHPVSLLLSEPQAVVSPQMRQVGGSTSSLLITGWVEENRVPPHGRLRAWYHISNVGAEPIQDLKLSLHGSGFRPRTLEGCGAPRGVRPAGTAALAQIDPGASCTLAVETGATAEAGEYMLTAGFSWTGPQRAPRFEALALGPVGVRSQQRERIAGLLSLLVQLSPIFVPVSLALLGFWFQQRQQQFVHERQAWTAMLPVSHENNSSLYLPLLSAIRSFRKNQPTTEGFFYLLLTIRLMRDVSGQGGFFLKDRKGEDLVTELWSAVLKSLREAFVPVETLVALVDAVQPNDSFSRFQRKLTRLKTLEATLPGLEATFQSWCLKEGKQCLSLFYAVLHHEMNRIYVFWYGREQVLAPEQVKELRAQGEASDLEISVEKRLESWIARHRSWRARWYDLKGRSEVASALNGTVDRAARQQPVATTTQETAAPELGKEAKLADAGQLETRGRKKGRIRTSR
jgi:hypothetical protein